LLPPSAVCALAAHAVVYRSLQPAGSAHGYFAWYEPLVGALTLASAGALVAVAVLAATGRSLRFGLDGATGRDLWARIAAGGVLLFFAQESLERSLAGSAGVASLSADSWLIVLAAVAAFAALIALVVRSGVVLALRGPAARPSARAPLTLPGPRRVHAPRRRRPLAERRGLRAPPAPAV
jgi:hypothetical protein